MATDFDALRARLPHLGLAVYAYEPGGPVTLEVHYSDDYFYAVSGPTLAEVLRQAFPEPEEAAPLARTLVEAILARAEEPVPEEPIELPVAPPSMFD